ncbi:hypothetical protein SFR_0735 [Streptomyces sp. FR-008]|nr:hypothetical protein SFR_0735 [Streptomyces sp. FR-008]
MPPSGIRTSTLPRQERGTQVSRRNREQRAAHATGPG